MKKISILIAVILFSNYLFAKYPKVYVSIMPKKITANTKVEVTLAAVVDKKSKIIFPNIKTIGGNSVISKKVDTKQSKELINDKNVTITKKTTSYTIKPTDSFDIESFLIKIDKKDYRTVPFRVKVDKKDAKREKVDKKVKKDIIQKESKKSKPKVKNSIATPLVFKMSSNKDRAVIGESFIIKVELFEPIDLSSADLEYTAPKFNGFKAQPLGEGKILEQGDSVIRTIEYLVTPIKTGKLTIEPAVAKIGIQVAPQAQSPFGFFGTDIQWKTVKSNPLKIEVSNTPEDVDFVGSFRLKAIVESKYAKPNKPFNYTLQIDGIGNIDDVKEPKFDITGVTSYTEEPKIEHIANKGKIYSKYSKKYVFIADKDFTIPAIEFRVYSPKSKKVYTIKTEPYKVKVKKSRTIADALSGIKSDVQKALKNPKELVEDKKSIPKEDNFENQDKEIAKIEDLLFDKYYYKRKYSIDGYPFSALFGAFILGLILGMGAILLSRFILRAFKKVSGKDRDYTNYDEALALLYPHITESKEIENMVENLYEVVNGNRDLKIDDYALKRMIKKIKKPRKNYL